MVTGFGIYETLKITKLRQGQNFSDGSGFTEGVTTGVVATIFFTMYSTELNTHFLGKLSEVWAKDYQNFRGIAFFTLVIMGIVTTLVLTLTFMQLFKSSNNLKKKAV